MDYYPPTLVDGVEIPPEAAWMLSVTSLFILALFVVAAVLIHRKYGGEPQRGLVAPPPIPQRVEYDSSLSPSERSFELEWIEGLMVAPAYGEASPRADQHPEGTDR